MESAPFGISFGFGLPYSKVDHVAYFPGGSRRETVSEHIPYVEAIAMILIGVGLDLKLAGLPEAAKLVKLCGKITTAIPAIYPALSHLIKGDTKKSVFEVDIDFQRGTQYYFSGGIDAQLACSGPIDRFVFAMATVRVEVTEPESSDLVPENVFFGQRGELESPYANVPMQMAAVIKNAGTRASDEPAGVSFRNYGIGPWYLGVGGVPSLSPNGKHWSVCHREVVFDRSGETKIEVLVEGGGSLMKTVTVLPNPGPPTITLDADPQLIPHTGERLSAVTATVRHSWGALVYALPDLKFHVSPPGETTETYVYQGKARLYYTAPSYIAGDVVVSATAHIDGQDVTASIVIKVVGLPNPTMSLTAEPSAMDIGGTTTLTAFIKNTEGIPAANIDVRFCRGHPASGLTIGTSKTDGEGKAKIAYTPPGSPGLYDVWAEATVEGVYRLSAVSLRVGPYMRVGFYQGWWFRSASVDINWVIPVLAQVLRFDETPIPGIQVSFREGSSIGLGRIQGTFDRVSDMTDAQGIVSVSWTPQNITYPSEGAPTQPLHARATLQEYGLDLEGQCNAYGPACFALEVQTLRLVPEHGKERPAANATIRLNGAPKGKTNNQGSLVIPGVLKGQHQVTASHLYYRDVGTTVNLVPIVFPGFASVGFRTKVVLTFTDRVTPTLTLTANPTSVILGTATVLQALLQKDGVPTEGMTICFESSLPGSFVLYPNAMTDGSGSATISWNAATTGTADITAYPVDDPTLKAKATVTVAAPISLAARVWTDKGVYRVGESVSLIFTLNAPCEWKLTVTKPDGSQVVYGPSRYEAGTHVISSVAGYPVGSRTVLLEAWVGSQRASAVTSFIVVEPIEPPRHTLTIIVFDAKTGVVIAGASVYIDGNLVGATDSGGTPVATNVQEGVRVIKVAKANYHDTVQNINVTSDLTVRIPLTRRE